MDPEESHHSSNVSSVSMVANRISFANIATLLERIMTSPLKDRLDRLKVYLNHIRSNFQKAHGTLDPSKANNDSLYSIVRIFLPTEDRGRGPYNIRGPTLGKIYAKILSLDKESDDGKKLLHYKDPGKSGFSTGSLPSIIFSILERRFSSITSTSSTTNLNKKGPFLSELHEILDSIVKTDNHKQSHQNSDVEEHKVNIEDQCRILRSFIQRLTPLEGKWLANILLKQMGLGLSKKQIFKCIHPQAQELYDKVRNLKQVCIRLNDPKTLIDNSDSGIKLFQPFKPMLSSRLLSIQDNEEGEEKRNKLKQSSRSGASDYDKLPAPPFYVEIKWDGERFQIHYDSSKPINDRFRYFSRNSFDCTLNFNKTLTPRLKLQIQSGCDSFILDGEMMAWKYSTKSFTQKGANIDVKKMKIDNPNHCPAFVAYDLVYFNGDDLTSKPLNERMELLAVKKLVVMPLDGVVILSHQKIVNSAEQVNEALNNAIDNSEEGLMVKSIHSTYKIGQRGAAWLKAKPEYYDGNSVDDLDLVILGGYYSESTRKGGSINNFLVGLIDNSNTAKEGFYPLSRIQSRRLKDPEMEDLVKKLESEFTRTEDPAYNIHFTGKKRPDLFINPKQSIVVQVKASEIIYNSGSALKYTLRFPRIIAIRHDKSWEDIMTVKEFHAIRLTYGGKLACRSDGLSPQEPTAKKQISKGRGEGPNLNVRTQTSKAGQSSSTSPLQLRRTRGMQKQLSENPPTTISTSLVSPKHFNIPAIYSSSRSNMMRKFNSINQSSSKQTPAISDEISRDIFSSLTFSVEGSTDWKSKTQALIKEYGGTVVQNPTKNCFAIVAEILSIKVKNFIQGGKYDILKLEWIEKCIKNKKIQKILPEHLWFAGPQTKKALKEDFDCYGDSYTKPLSSVKMKTMLESVMKLMDEIVDSDSTESDSETESQVLEELNIGNSNEKDSQESFISVASYSHKPVLKRVIEKEIEDKEDVLKLRKYNFLDGCKIAFRQNPEDKSMDALKLFQLSTQIEFHGGLVCTDEDAEDVTHVVVFGLPTPVKTSQLCAHVVRGKWLLDCLEKKSIVEELYYMVH